MAPPYLYWNATGHLIEKNAAGIYPNATKCDVNDWVDSGNSTLQIVFYVSCGVILMYGFYSLMKKKKATEKRIADLQKLKDKDDLDQLDPLDTTNEPQRRLTIEQKNDIKVQTSSTQKFSRWTFLALGVAIGIEVVAGVLITTWSAQKLTVDELDATNDANNYLNPFEDVFQFFEDGMTVRIGQAMGANDFITSGLLIRWASLGGFITGLVGATFSTIITFIDPIYSFFVPTTTASVLPKNCAIIPTLDDIQQLARPYWILTSFSWIAVFINKASIGFLLGTGETQYWAIAIGVSSLTSIGLWWGLIDNENVSHTTTAGLINLIPPFIFLIVAFICFYRPKYIKMYKFNSFGDMFTKKGVSISYQAAKDGTHLLLKDLLLTLQKSISLIMAAHIGLGGQYQLLLYNTIQGVYGYSYGSQNSGSVFPITLGYGMRLTGSRFLGGKNYKAFKWMAKAYVIGSVLFGFIAFISISIFNNAIPYNYVSDTTCKYQEYECSLNVYNDIFDNIKYGIIICGLMCWFNSVFSILQATLYAALDFKFIRNATVIVFFVVYLPTACVSYFKYKSVIGLLISYNIPILILDIVYIYRLFFVIFPNIDSFVTKRMGVSSKLGIEIQEPLLINESISTHETDKFDK